MIDPKELRIGAHISVTNERVVVDEITNNSLVAYITPDGNWEACSPDEDWIEPIPITDELLTELGFLKMEEHGSVSVWLRRNIRIDFYDTRIVAMVGNENDYTDRCTISPIHYLHELEAFLYLTTKTELIKV